MPMGWVPSPAIAQRSVRVMLAAAGLQWGQDACCWIDNILVTAATAEELESKLARFLQVMDDLRVTYRIEEKGEVLDYIGLTLDLPQQLFVLQTKFRSKFQDMVSEAVEAGMTSYKQFQRLAGCCAWYHWATRRPFLGMRHVLQTLSFETVRRTKLTELSDSLLPAGIEVMLSQDVVNELTTAANQVGESRAMPFAPNQRPPLLSVMMTTDASETGGAVVFSLLDKPTKVLLTKYWPWADRQHINVLELRTLDMALDSVTDLIAPQNNERTAMKWNSDSMVSIQVYNKMYSRSPPLAELLESIRQKLDELSLDLQPEHVPTDKNIADKPSRLYEETRFVPPAHH
jgi:hypothetical protein